MCRCMCSTVTSTICFILQVLAQIELWTNTSKYPVGLYYLPKKVSTKRNKDLMDHTIGLYDHWFMVMYVVVFIGCQVCTAANTCALSSVSSHCVQKFCVQLVSVAIGIVTKINGKKFKF